MAIFVRTQEIDHQIGATGVLSVRLASSDLELRGVAGDTARVRATFELRAETDAEADEIFAREQLRHEAGPGRLDVSERRPSLSVDLPNGIGRLLGLRGGKIDTHISIEAPVGATIRVNAVSSDVTATDLGGEQHYTTVSGDLVLSEVGGQLQLQSVSGDVSIRATDPIGLDARAISGDLSVIAPVVDLLRANTVSGDIEVDAALRDGPGHRVETVSGDFALGLTGELELEVRGISTEVDISVPHRTQGSRDRRRYLIGESGPELTFSSMSGDVTVNPSRRPRGTIQPPAATAAPTPPAAPAPPAASNAPTLPSPPAAPAPVADPASQLEILRAVERGEIDVDEAARRLTKG